MKIDLNLDNILVLSRLDNSPGAHLMPAGTKAVTADCGHECLVSPQGIAVLEAELDVVSICLVCIGEQGIAEDQPVQVVAGAAEELAAIFGESVESVSSQLDDHIKRFQERNGKFSG